MKKIESLRDLLVHELKDMYHAEKQLLKALPRMAKAASDSALQEALTAHLAETDGHVERLEQVFGLLEVKPAAVKCKGMEGLLAEGDGNLTEIKDPEALDAAIIASAQRVEHYEIAAYGTARAFAKRLGLKDVERLLTATLDEESEADSKLTRIAEGTVNGAAVE